MGLLVIAVVGSVTRQRAAGVLGRRIAGVFRPRPARNSLYFD
jgi:hypothetical protein